MIGKMSWMRMSRVSWEKSRCVVIIGADRKYLTTDLGDFTMGKADTSAAGPAYGRYHYWAVT